MTTFADDVEVPFFPATAVDKPDYDPIDISSKSFWLKSAEEREEAYRELRHNRPVSWQRPVEDAVVPDPNDPGYWAVVTHEHIVQVSRDHETFISGQGVLMDLLPANFLEMTQSFLAMDDPKHNKLRRLVSSTFTPKQLKRIEDKIKERAQRIIDDLLAADGEVDFVSEVSIKLPLLTFCDIFGVPEEFMEETRKAAHHVVAWSDPEVLQGRPASEVQLAACQSLHDIASRVIALRRESPTDDLFTALVHAEVDGEQLSEFEIGSFFVLMAVAGTDTTTNTTSNTVLEFTKNPEQREWLMEDYDGRINVAIEEFIRRTTPVMTFRRTAVKETTLAGQKIIPGDKVVLFYPSGNNDETVFGDPENFRLDRNPNPHVAFGGGGVHFCLGNQLAKMMLRAIFWELLTRIKDFRATEPVFQDSNFMRAVKRMKFEFTPEGR